MTSNSEIQPGIEFDRRVCRLLGVTPRITWEILTQNEKASAFSSDDEREVRQVFKEYAECPGWSSYHVGTWEHYPAVSQDDAAALSVCSAYAQRESIPFCLCYLSGEPDKAWLVTVGEDIEAGIYLADQTYPTLALALCAEFMRYAAATRSPNG